MPDYNLGTAHGKIVIDYDDKGGARRAAEDVDRIGTKSQESSRKVQSSNQDMQRAYANLTNSINRLQSSFTQSQRAVNSQQSAYQRLISSTSSIDQNTRRSASGLNLFTNRLKLLIGGIAVATPGVAGLGVSLVALTGVAGVAAGALAAAGAAAATLAVGTAGIGDVFEAAAADSKAAGGAAASSASQQKAAARAIEQAKRSLADAEENLQRVREDAARAAIQAERAILSAQRDLVNAQRDAIRAQESLSKARRDATRQLEDMRAALTGGSLDERQATLDLAEAQDELNKVIADPTANQRDRDQAILNLEKQRFALEQTRKANQRLGVDQAEAAAKGVAGSDAVVSAQDAVRDAFQNVQGAQQSLADAQEGARQQQVDSARAIRDAVRSIEDAQRNLAEAYESAAESAGGASSKTADALANISPNARAVVKEILGLKDEWQALKFSVQDRLFAGLADDIKPLANIYFPLLQEGMGGIADGFNSMITNVVEFLKTGEAIDNIRQIFGNTGLAVGNLSTVARDLLAAFLDIAAVGSDFLPDLALDASDAAARFREFIAAARESGKLREWMQGGIDAAGQLWQLLKNVGSIIGTIFSAFDQEGGGALATLTALTGKIDEFLKSAEGQEALHALGRILAAIGGAYGKVFLSFLDVAGEILVALEPLIVAFADAAGVYLAGALQVLGVVLAPIAQLLGALGPALGPVIAGIYAANKAVAAAKVAWGLLNTVMNANPFLVIAAAIIALALLIIQNWDSISAFLTEAWNTIWTEATRIWDAIYQAIIQPIIDAYNSVVQWFTEMKNTIGSVLEAAWTAIKNAFNNIKNTISSAIGNAVDFVKNGLSKIGTFFRELPGKVIDFLKSLPGRLADWAGDLISGIVRGLGNMAGAIWNKLKQIVSDAWDSVLDFFGISSPAREGIWAGEMIGRGLAQGIEGSIGMVAKAASNLSEATAISLPGFDPKSPSGMAFKNGGSQSTPVGLTLPQTAAATKSSGSVTNIYIGDVKQTVAGTLDPTNPVQWRRAMVSMKDGIRNVERDYA